MFLITYHYKKPIAVIDEYRVAHRAYLDTCYQKDWLIVSGPKNSNTGAVLLSQLKECKQLEELLQADPFVIHKLVDYEITEFNPIKYHKEFKHFIENNNLG